MSVPECTVTLSIQVEDLRVTWTMREQADEFDRPATFELNLSQRRRETIELLERLLRNSTDVEKIATDLENTTDGDQPLYAALLNVVGHELFDLLFVGRLRTAVSEALWQLDRAEVDRFRIRLVFKGNEARWLSRLPWEYARTPPDDDAFPHPDGAFLADSAELVLSRGVDRPHSRSLKVTDWPVRVLLVCSSPIDADGTLDRVDAIQVVKTLKELESEHIVELREIVEPEETFRGPEYQAMATWQEFSKIADAFQPMIVHFIGHGHCAAGKGALAFTQSNGDVHWVTDERFTKVATSCKQLKLVFLQACKSALPDPYVSFSGVAQSLAAAGMPAVIGMQYRVAASVANAFAVRFYKALLRENMPISSAVQAARKELSWEESESRLAFGLPVVYLASDAILGPRDGLRRRPDRQASVDRNDRVVFDMRCPRCEISLDGSERQCPSCELRLICPEPGCGARYLDPERQERCENCKAAVRRETAYGRDAVDAVTEGATASTKAALAFARGPGG